MQTSEEFAALITDFSVHSPERASDLIRARDAEVRAETLAGFTEERGFRDDRGRDHALPPGHEPEDVPQVFTRTRRLVGPWEPDPRTPEQRSDDAVDTLRERLSGERS
ncbi:hypothetical protein [Janibacter terrae]|uniref:hypothetical protein n=1 Tax=Janibacter terrae TaxID=103817 RepID=UPI0031F7F862